MLSPVTWRHLCPVALTVFLVLVAIYPFAFAGRYEIGIGITAGLGGFMAGSALRPTRWV